MQIHTSAALPNESVKLKTCTITTIIFSTKASLRKKPTLVCKCASVQVCTHQEETETAHHKRGMRDGVFVPQISLCIVLFYFFFCTFSLKFYPFLSFRPTFCPWPVVKNLGRWRGGQKYEYCLNYNCGGHNTRQNCQFIQKLTLNLSSCLRGQTLSKHCQTYLDQQV